MQHAKHLPGLDLLRAVAISLVLCYHVKVFFTHPPALDSWTSFGWTGVDLFFVLSGFLITSQLLEARSHEGIQLKAYFIKRAFRILPLYWLMVAVYFLLPSWREIQSPAPLWKFLSFTQNLGLDTVGNRTFSHAWSLCIEEQFYLVLPLVLLVLNKWIRLQTLALGCVSLMLAGFVVRFLSWTHLVEPHLQASQAWNATSALAWGRWIYYPTQCRLDGLLTGVLIASVFQWRPHWRTWSGHHPLPFLGLGTALMLLGWKLGSPMNGKTCALYGYPVIALGYGALLIAAISPSVRLPRLVAPAITWLATLSYGIYLSHKVAGHLLQEQLVQFGFSPTGWLMFACLIAGCLLTGLALHFFIERPAFQMRDLLLRRIPHPSRTTVAGNCSQRMTSMQSPHL